MGSCKCGRGPGSPVQVEKIPDDEDMPLVPTRPGGAVCSGSQLVLD